MREMGEGTPVFLRTLLRTGGSIRRVSLHGLIDSPPLIFQTPGSLLVFPLRSRSFQSGRIGSVQNLLKTPWWRNKPWSRLRYAHA